MDANDHCPFSAVAIFALLSACSHPSGSTSFEFIDSQHPEPAVDAAQLDVSQGINAFVQAKPELPLAALTYPKAALDAGIGSTTIAVTIDIGRDGRVEDVRPCAAAVRIPTRFDREFDAAIRAAVAQWQFEPAKSARLEPSKNGPIVTEADDVATSLNVVFVFSQAGTAGYRMPK
jgi:TonB family protein